MCAEHELRARHAAGDAHAIPDANAHPDAAAVVRAGRGRFSVQRSSGQPDQYDDRQ